MYRVCLGTSVHFESLQPTKHSKNSFQDHINQLFCSVETQHLFFFKNLFVNIDIFRFFKNHIFIFYNIYIRMTMIIPILVYLKLYLKVEQFFFKTRQMPVSKWMILSRLCIWDGNWDVKACQTKLLVFPVLPNFKIVIVKKILKKNPDN